MLPPSLTRPVTAQAADLNVLYRDVGDALARLTKAGAAATRTHALSGELYATPGGWLLLRVPNALVRGAFDALDENGAQLPLYNGKLNAHISVMRPEELARIGGVDKVTERGHHFHYTLGPVKEVEPAGWKEMSKVWFIEADSPELKELRKSYGLSPVPDGGDKPFHITVAVRKKNVLKPSDEVTKHAAVERLVGLFCADAAKAGREEVRGPEAEYCPHCDARLERDPYDGKCNSCGKDWPAKAAAHVPHGGTASYDYHCGPCDHSFDGCAGVCPLCGADRSATTTNPRLKTAAGLLVGLLEGLG